MAPDPIIVRAGQTVRAFGDGQPGAEAGIGLLVQGGRIARIAAADALIAAHPNAVPIGEPRHIAMPGLVNAHSHGRGIDSARLGLPDDWLEAWIPHYAALPPLDPYLDTLLSSLSALLGGVTTVIHVSYPRAPFEPEISHREALRAHLDAGIRVAYVPDVQDRHDLVYRETGAFLDGLDPTVAAALRETAPPMGDEVAPAYAAMLARLARDFAGHDRVRLLVGPEGPEWCSERLLLTCAALMRDLDLGLQIHVLESPVQAAFARTAFPDGSVAALDRLGLLGERSSLAHGTWLGAEDRARAAGTGTTVVHNPSSNLRLRSGIAPVAAMLEAGVGVGIGMDSTTIDGDEDMFREIRLAHLLHGLPRPEPWASRPSPAAMLAAATTGGARAAGFGPGLGRLEEGAPADILLLDWQAAEAPLLTPVGPEAWQIVQFATRRLVDTVIVGGRVRVAGGRLVDHDLAAVGEALRDCLGRTPADVTRRAAAVARADAAIRRDFETRLSGIPCDPAYAPNRK